MIDRENLTDAIREHGNQLGENLAYLKRFLDAQQERQQAFLAEQRKASDKAQANAQRAAIWSAVAAVAAAVAAGLQAYDAWITP